MSFDHFDRFVELFCAGIGLALVGALNLLLPRLSRRTRVSITAAAAGAAVTGVTLWHNGFGAVSAAVAVLSLTVLPGLAPYIRPAALLRTRVARAVCRPAVAWGLLLAAGLGTVVAAGAVYESADQDMIDREMHTLALIVYSPPLEVVDQAATDRGTPVALKRPSAVRGAEELSVTEETVLREPGARERVIRRQPADEGTNCHGWVFTGGKFWVPGESVERILEDNGYQPVSSPRPGDLAIYRSGGSVVHTGVVRYTADGLPALVESKWGGLGVFLHQVDQSVYGGEYTYYRSPRPGHLLGYPSSPGPKPGETPAVTSLEATSAATTCD